MVTDLHMRELDGLSLLREARSMTPDTSVVLVSSCFDEEIVQHMFDEGAADFLLKPFPCGDSTASIRSAMQLHRLCRKVILRNRVLTQLQQRLAKHRVLIGLAEQRQYISEPIKRLVFMSRALNRDGLASLQSSLDRLTERHAEMEGILQASEARFAAAKVTIQRRAFERLSVQ